MIDSLLTEMLAANPDLSMAVVTVKALAQSISVSNGKPMTFHLISSNHARIH